MSKKILLRAGFIKKAIFSPVKFPRHIRFLIKVSESMGGAISMAMIADLIVGGIVKIDFLSKVISVAMIKTGLMVIRLLRRIECKYDSLLSLGYTLRESYKRLSHLPYERILKPSLEEKIEAIRI